MLNYYFTRKDITFQRDPDTSLSCLASLYIYSIYIVYSIAVGESDRQDELSGLFCNAKKIRKNWIENLRKMAAHEGT